MSSSGRSKERLDVLLAARGLARSREFGQRLIMAGEVRVDGQPVTKPGTRVPVDAEITVVERPPFVSRGGEKLAAALDRFQIDPTGWVCADVGASTGGFTDCLLQAGASKVYAIDVGYGQLAWSIRQDARVVVMERVNARHLDVLPEVVDCATIDVSFISLRLILPVVREWLTPDSQVVALVKPQFEAGREAVGKGGVVKDPATHTLVLEEITEFAYEAGFQVRGLIPSPLRGPAGNVEFLLWLSLTGHGSAVDDLQGVIEEAVAAAHNPPT
jgi:23S rRNA (cytidine1920-2'-O)/16S rRNA (cytidine1409-2'-O)-methyltransferase